MVKWWWIAETHPILQGLFSVTVCTSMEYAHSQKIKKKTKKVKLKYGNKNRWKGLCLVWYWYRVLSISSASSTQTMILESCWMSVLSGFNCFTILYTIIIFFFILFLLFVLCIYFNPVTFYVHTIICKIIFFCHCYKTGK